MFVNKLISPAHISESKMCFNVKSPAYFFHMKTKILADFQICISVPLNEGIALAVSLGVLRSLIIFSIIFTTVHFQTADVFEALR